MKLSATRCPLTDIEKFRDLFLQENNFQIRYNACHERNWSDSWLLSVEGVAVGYGSVKGKDNIKDRDAVFEFYVIPAFRKYRGEIFQVLLNESGAPYIACQSNDFMLSSLTYEFAKDITADVVLLGESRATDLKNPGVTFRPRIEGEKIFVHIVEPPGDYVLEKEGEVVATGGFMLHYNYPFADLYMEVREDMRKRGFGSYLLQEVKRVCYLSGRVPAARTSIKNIASRSCLIKAGLEISGYMLTGTVIK